MARVLLGVTGGIAAYKALELTRLATKAGHSVRVIQTEASTRFVGTASFSAITGAPVLVTEWEPDPLRGAFPGDQAPEHAPLSHLALVERADLYVIAPASANTIAKLAGGHADNLLTAAALACRRPLIVAPAMNHAMYEHPATRANLETLRARGVEVLEPATGALGSPGEWGVGRLPEPAELLAAIEARLGGAGGQLDGAHVLVTAGGTREPIDAVRFIGNRSSGRMGFALAERAARRGAEVTLIAANASLPGPAAVRRVDVETAAELADAIKDEFARTHVLLMAAAVADFRPARPEGGKIAREGTGGLDLRLEQTDDILAELSASRRSDQTLVGFAAEHGAEAIERAREKLGRKGLDAIVFNDVSRADIGFDSELNEVTIVEPGGDHAVATAPKDEVAEAILDRVEALRSGASSRQPAAGG
jgi:phosphopantothenoylcysteine decarboxylase/phosphopantothenate--cysteine ligase